MTSFIAPRADWRLRYSKRPCILCGFRALFHVDRVMPACDGCRETPRKGTGMPTENVLSDVVYHGHAYSDDPVGDSNR